MDKELYETGLKLDNENGKIEDFNRTTNEHQRQIH